MTDTPENRFPVRTIDILIPSRKRPEALEKAIRSIHDTAAEPDKVTVAVWADADDKATGEKVAEIAKWAEKKLREIVLLHGKPRILSDIYNELAGWTEGEVIMYAADDIVFETDGWDDAVRKAFLEYKDRIALVWCHDPSRPDYGQFPDHGFISRWAMNTVKYVFPSFPPHPDYAKATGISFTDIWLNTLYTHLKRTKLLADTYIRHDHWHPRYDGDSHDKPLDDNYCRHAILSSFRKTPEFAMRMAELPTHAATLQKFIDWVDGGGLEREVSRNLAIDAMYAEPEQAVDGEPNEHGSDGGDDPPSGD